jgi:hypothetical protein
VRKITIGLSVNLILPMYIGVVLSQPSVGLVCRVLRVLVNIGFVCGREKKKAAEKWSSLRCYNVSKG